MTTSNDEMIEALQAVETAKDRLTRLRAAHQAAVEIVKDLRTDHGRTALVAEFDPQSRSELSDLETRLTEATTREAGLLAAIGAAEDDLKACEVRARELSAGGFFASSFFASSAGGFGAGLA